MTRRRGLSRPPYIENKTQWRTDDMRCLIIAGLKHCGASMHKRINLIERRRGPLGRAVFDQHDREGGWIMLALPFIIEKGKTINSRPGEVFSGTREHLRSNPMMRRSQVRQIAGTLMHELAHNFGVRHKEMSRQACREDVEWSDAFEIRLRAQPKKVTAVERSEKRELHVRKMIAKHERQLARTQKLLKQWRQKARYYDAKHKKAADRRS